MKERALSLAMAAAALALAAPTATQIMCPLGDDGFAAAPWCQRAMPNLPQFPPFQIDGKYCCILDCRLEREFPLRVSTRHIPVLCDLDFIVFTVSPGGAGAPGWSGLLVAKYARTWTEPTVAGLPRRQVWRFLINGDLTATAGQPPCPLPPHGTTAAGTTSHFHGHIDYACESDAAGNQVFRMALSMHHLPGCVSHSLFSGAPLFGPPAHDDRSYHMVAPAAFDCTPVPVRDGTMASESLRSAGFTPRYTCFGEAPVPQGAVRNTMQNWLCGSATGGPFSWQHQRIDGVALCAGVTERFSCLPLPAPLPPVPDGCTALGLGVYTNPPEVFPGKRELSVHWGVMLFRDQCNPNDFPLHFVHGVSTNGPDGFLFTTPSGPFTYFLDLSDSFLFSSLFPGWGSVFFSKRVWNLNIP